MSGRDKRRQETAPATVDEPATPAEPETTGEPPADVSSEPPVERAGDGRPKCTVDGCPLPEFMDGVGLCGGHWATRPDLRKGARRAR